MQSSVGRPPGSRVRRKSHLAWATSPATRCSSRRTRWPIANTATTCAGSRGRIEFDHGNALFRIWLTTRTKLFDQAIEKARALPEEDQDALAKTILALAEGDPSGFPIDDETRSAILEGLR